MHSFTRLLSLLILVSLLGLAACQRRSQALLMPEQHVAAAARATAAPPAEPLVAAVAPIAPVVASEPTTALATTATDVRPYQRLNLEGRRNLVKLTPSPSAVKQAAKSIDKVSRKELKRQWRQRMSQPGSTVSGLAVASLVCGILAFFIFGVVLGILAIIFGGVALSKIRKNPEMSGRGMAVAGLVLGIVSTVVTLIYLISR